MYLLNRKLVLIFFISTLIFLFFYFINKKTIEKKNIPNLKTGDLIFRLGQGFDSRLISYLSDFTYSHVGYIVKEDDLFVIHATTDDNKEFRNQVIKSSIDNFISNSKKIAILRLNFLSKYQKNILSKALLRRLGEPFLLESSEYKNLYCTTLLEEEINKVYPLNLKYSQINTILFKGKYLFPRELFLLNDTKIIYKME